MIKLIAIDLDGTLLTDDKKISDRNKEILTKAKNQGVKVVICTGRPLISIHGYLDRLDLRDAGDFSITFNGGAVQKNDTGEELLACPLSLEEVQKMAKIMTELDLPLDIISNDTCINIPTSKSRKSIYQSINPILKYVTIEAADLDKETIFNKMVVAADVDYLDEQLKSLPKEAYAEFNIMKSRDNLLEIIRPDVSKANGIDLLAKELGIKQSEVMALGDEENDESMIAYAGMGVVMANGNEELKKIAQFVTKSNEEDGVAYAVEKFVLKD